MSDTLLPAEVNSDMSMSEWIAVTLGLEEDGFGLDITNFEGDIRADWLTQMLFATVCEVVEMGDEVGWKAWSKPRGWVNREQAISEAADALHFIGLILAAVKCTGEEFTAQYLRKVQLNYDRQAAGDDVRDRRCPGCGRSLDDVGVKVRASGEKYCNSCGETLKGAL